MAAFRELEQLPAWPKRGREADILSYVACVLRLKFGCSDLVFSPYVDCWADFDLDYQSASMRAVYD